MALVEPSTIFDEARVSAEVRKLIYDMDHSPVATSPTKLKRRIASHVFKAVFADSDRWNP